MAKRTAVIDIGSNSVRMVIYERTSRYAFHLLREEKSRVRIGEGAYGNNGHLTDEAMDRAYKTIQEYIALAEAYKCRKILSVATSALRDAPNKKTFINRVSKELGLNIRVIDGNKEAYLGGLAALNLLPLSDGVTIDIGGGSTELALIKEGRIDKVVSLDIGTVRLKELFFDTDQKEKAVEFIHQACLTLDESFIGHNVIGIGGSIRAISNAYLKSSSYPIKVLHGFSYKSKDIKKFAQKIIDADEAQLKKLQIKPERFDVIGAGAMIYGELLGYLNSKKALVSSVGVREGVYIQDFLRSKTQERFPEGINPTMRSIQDRYITDMHASKLLKKCALELFDTLQERLNLSVEYRELLGISALLSEIGIGLNYYDFERHSFYLILHSLYGLTHQQTLLVATLVRYHTKKKPSKEFRAKYEALLPKNRKLKGLIFILALSRAMLNGRPQKIPFEITLKEGKLYLKSLQDNCLAIEKIERLNQLIEIEVVR